ncbi:Hypothetical predicted protein [Pelobates cultripes]|uniref:Uncharacterized protein n=1 Tax=Pelobates cultripes TaxID=61616 RepID=A0AAD1SX69_PELCU|nr:Hypothetical predicted protein [Pelobates cultripes]
MPEFKRPMNAASNVEIHSMEASRQETPHKRNIHAWSSHLARGTARSPPPLGRRGSSRPHGGGPHCCGRSRGGHTPHACTGNSCRRNSRPADKNMDTEGTHTITPWDTTIHINEPRMERAMDGRLRPPISHRHGCPPSESGGKCPHSCEPCG